MRRHLPLFVSCGLLLAFSKPAAAQIAYPMLMSLKPVAAQAGQTSELTVQSRYTMFGAYRVLVSGDGVTGEVVHPNVFPAADGKLPEVTSLPIRFTVAPDAQPGVRDFRIATPQGVSTVGQLVIVRDPVVVESADNDTPAKAQPVSLPATICGAIEKAEDVDFFKFQVEAGTAWTFHVRGARLQDRIHDLQQHADPIVTLRSADGATLASSDNHFFGDPLLAYRFDKAGEYLLEVRDVRYLGNQYWQYSIEVNQRPFVENAFPLGVSPGQPVQWQLVGPHAATLLAASTLSPQTPMGSHWLRLPMGGDATNPVPLVVTDLPLVIEADGDNATPERAQPVAVPTGINGRIQTEGDIDCFAFDAKQGEAFSFEIIARRRQSALDSHLRVLNDKGQQLAANDDLRIGKRNFADSWIENWTAPAAGRYVVEVRDVHLRGGSQFPYFLKITRSEPYFELYVDTDKTQVQLGTSAAIYCRVERKCGFTGEVQLHIDGLPSEITASCGRILPDKSVDGCIVLQAEVDALPVAENVTIRGTATHTLPDGRVLQLSAVAQPYQETYQPGGGRGHWPVDSHAVAVTNYGDLRSVSLSDHEISLKPGESKKIEINIDRSPGSNQNVTLEATYQHLGTVFGNSLPPGVTVDDKNSKTLLSGGATQGYITLKAAPDAAPVERQQSVVMANIALNFVMKATYASRPVWITVAK